MKTWFQLVFNTIKVFVLFTGCTILFYYGLLWVNQEYQNYHRYDEPEGSAIKVSSMVSETEQSLFDRLWIFYHFGE
ncbi:YqzK family protein [Bacillus sp. DJP31]|uniref:YqzK family protein n=1 Tax=Bacillus sp. DJP31 TaxID=3409789 RepID=UPI003BB6E84D